MIVFLLIFIIFALLCPGLMRAILGLAIAGLLFAMAQGFN